MARIVVVEVGELVVEQKAPARDDDPVASGGLDRERVGDRHPVAIGDGQVGRRPAFAIDPDPPGRSGVVGRVAGGNRPLIGGLVGDQRPALRREGIGEQALERHVEEPRIGEVGVAVGERVSRGLDETVQCLGAVGPQRRVALEDVERLADGRAAARRRTHAPDVVAAIADAGRLATDGLVGLEVALGDQARAPDVVGIGGGRWVLRGVGDRAGDSPAIEALRAALGDPPVGARHVGISQLGADVPRRPVRIEVDRRRRRDVVEEVDVDLDLVEEGLVDPKALCGRPRSRARVPAPASSCRTCRAPAPRWPPSPEPRSKGRCSGRRRTRAERRWQRTIAAPSRRAPPRARRSSSPVRLASARP